MRHIRRCSIAPAQRETTPEQQQWLVTTVFRLAVLVIMTLKGESLY